MLPGHAGPLPTEEPAMPDTFVVACPVWCRRPSGHDLADRDAAGVVRRIHLGERVAGVELEQFETVDAAGSVSAGQVWVNGPSGRHRAAQVPGVLAVSA